MSFQFSNLAIFTLEILVLLDPILILTLLPKLLNSFITSRLDYCNSILFGLSDESLKRLRKVRNTVV